MAAENYSAQRRQMAKKRGLGSKREAARPAGQAARALRQKVTPEGVPSRPTLRALTIFAADADHAACSTSIMRFAETWRKAKQMQVSRMICICLAASSKISVMISRL